MPPHASLGPPPPPSSPSRLAMAQAPPVGEAGGTWLGSGHCWLGRGNCPRQPCPPWGHWGHEEEAGKKEQPVGNRPFRVQGPPRAGGAGARPHLPRVGNGQNRLWQVVGPQAHPPPPSHYSLPTHDTN